jgi:hypothetical protein
VAHGVAQMQAAVVSLRRALAVGITHASLPPYVALQQRLELQHDAPPLLQPPPLQPPPGTAPPPPPSRRF